MIRLSLIAFALLGAANAAPGEIRLAPDDIAALTPGETGPGTSGLAGVTTTVLAGDPSKAGPYTIRLSVPPHTVIAAHAHRDDRSAVVISGVWYFGYGDTNTEAALKPLPPGSFYTEPPERTHFARTGEDAVIVYITGTGPTDTVYVDPAAAPHS
ncbi:MAG: cupin domain-containing protein [Micropepsaceae bacterium]